jgi:hypothetical protein
LSTAFGAKIDSGKSGGSGPEITKPKSYFSRELSNEKVNVSKLFGYIFLNVFLIPILLLTLVKSNGPK